MSCFDVDVQRIYRGFLFFLSPALQGHAIKNQDLLIASGAVTLKGAEGMSDLDEDMQIAVRALRCLTSVAALGVLGVPRQRGAWEYSFVLMTDVALLFRFSDLPSRLAYLTLRASLRRCSRVYFPAPLTSLRQLPKLNATMPVNDMTLDSDWFSWNGLVMMRASAFRACLSFPFQSIIGRIPTDRHTANDKHPH